MKNKTTKGRRPSQKSSSKTHKKPLKAPAKKKEKSSKTWNQEIRDDSWHFWWGWQLLHRNSYYEENFKKLRDTLPKNGGLLQRIELVSAEWTDENRPKLDGDANLESEFQRFLQYLRKQKLPPTRRLSTAFAIHTETEPNTRGSMIPLTTEELIALNDFRKKYSGIIDFPLDPKCKFPQPNILAGAMALTPVRDLSFSVATMLCVQNDNEQDLLEFPIAINLGFSADRIKKTFGELIDSLLEERKKHTKILGKLFDKSVKWNDFAHKLWAYDLSQERGMSNTKIAKKIWPKASLTDINRKSVSIKTWINSMDKYIQKLNPPF